MSSAIYILPRILPQRIRVYMHTLSKHYKRSRRASGAGSGASALFSCRCLSLFAILWIIVLWIFLSLDTPKDSSLAATYSSAHDSGIAANQDLYHKKRILDEIGLSRGVSPHLPFDINLLGKRIVNLPQRLYDNLANVVDNWANGRPADAGVGVLPPPDQKETLDLQKLGENGQAVEFKNLNPEQKKLMDEGWQRNAFNQYVSDRMSLNRSLPEVRDQECRVINYDYDLPTTSIVMCFHNEAWSVLFRGVHSILYRTPERMLKEIILVDDFSDQEHLKTRLDEALNLPVYQKVRVVRTKQREGLIRARLLGASRATGDVLTFLDSHIECAVGWAEPLLERIKQDESHVVCPVIDVIDDNTFKYHYSDAKATNLGGFDWNLQFNWHGIPDREKQRRKSDIEPLYSPTMAGGLFSISRAYFEKIGTYDAQMDIWGGENLELSFRVWMCGGTLEIVPCSHIGHIFRKRSPYKWKAGENVLKKNSVRLAMVWLDEYAEYYFQRINHDYGNYGDITSRVNLRNRLQCKNFSWYLENIYPELFVPGEAYSNGEIRNLGNGSGSGYCLDSPANKMTINKPVNMYPCHRQGGNQYWMLSKDGEIRRDEMCIDYAGKEPVIFPCHSQKGNQYWVYNPQTKLLQHYYSKKCMEMNLDGQTLSMNECDPRKLHQQWNFEKYKYGDQISNEVVSDKKKVPPKKVN